LSRTTLSLVFCEDFADQIENKSPALKAGFIVLADVTLHLMASDMVRGMDETWLKNVDGIARCRTAVFIGDRSEELVQREFIEETPRWILGERDGHRSVAPLCRYFVE